MVGDYNIGLFVLYMVALVFSLSFHEAAHAWMSNRFGDDLARLQGRITLNPTSHVDPVGTLLFPAIAFFTGAPLLGWARPTPVNPNKWRNKRVANIWVSAAGVIVNTIIAICAGIGIRVLYETGVVVRVGNQIALANTETTIAEGAVQLLLVLFNLNVVLAVFNLLPIPPLDGSKILSSLLPESFAPAFEAVERYGFILLIIALFTGVFGVIFNVISPLAWGIVFLGA